MAVLGRWRTVVAILLVVAAGLTGFGWPPPTARFHLRPPGPADRPASRPGVRVSRPAHLLVVIEENHSSEQIIGSPSAPFLNRLAAHGRARRQLRAEELDEDNQQTAGGGGGPPSIRTLRCRRRGHGERAGVGPLLTCGRRLSATGRRRHGGRSGGPGPTGQDHRSRTRCGRDRAGPTRGL